MNPGNDFANASFDAGLFPKFRDVFTRLPNDHPGIFGAHERTKGETIIASRGGGAGLRSGTCGGTNQNGEQSYRKGKTYQRRGERGRRRAW